jgi:VIT1/CCC1 family predicted Fe2+/Mn2+ transporter
MPNSKNKLKERLRQYKDYFISLFGGLESGLATTTAIVVGLALTTENQRIVAATALISAIVQAWNSAMSAISSGHIDHQIEHPYARDYYTRFIEHGALRFFSHIIASILPILPIVFMTDETVAVSFSIIITLILLSLLGYNKAKVVGSSKMRGTMEELVPGVLVISIGFIAGFILS